VWGAYSTPGHTVLLTYFTQPPTAQEAHMTAPNILKIDRSLLTTTADIWNVVDIIVESQYNFITLSAPGETDQDPNMTNLLLTMAQGRTSEAHDPSCTWYEGELVRTPVARFTALVQSMGATVDACDVAAFITEMHADFARAYETATPQRPALLVSRGEYWMSRLISLALASRGHLFPVISPEQFLRGDGRGSIDLHASKKMLTGSAFRLQIERRMIVPGYYVGNERGEIELLKREGTHITATVLAILFKSRQIDNISTLTGIPIVPTSMFPSPVIPIISHLELVELARVDQKIFQPEAVNMMRSHNICMRVCTPEDLPKGGTLLTFDPEVRRQADHVSSIGAVQHAHILTAHSDQFDQPGIVHTVGKIFLNQHINVRYYYGSVCSFVYVFHTDEHTAQLTTQLFKREWPHASITQGTCAVVYIVGTDMEQIPGMSARFYSALAAAGINVLRNLPGDAYKLTAAINPDDLEHAVHALYAEFFGTETTSA
jgi:aspartate kinase